MKIVCIFQNYVYLLITKNEFKFNWQFFFLSVEVIFSFLILLYEFQLFNEIFMVFSL